MIVMCVMCAFVWVDVSVNVHMYVCLHACAREHTHKHTYIHTYIYIHTHTHIHTHIYIHTHTHTHTHTNKHIHTPTHTGPKLPPVRTKEEIDKIYIQKDWATAMPFVKQTLGDLRKNVGNTATVLGFVGLPYTLATYLIEGGNFFLFRPTGSWV